MEWNLVKAFGWMCLFYAIAIGVYLFFGGLFPRAMYAQCCVGMIFAPILGALVFFFTSKKGG